MTQKKQPITRQRASKTRVNLDGMERNAARRAVIRQWFAHELTMGQALKKMRLEVLGISQQHYCKLVKISRQTLSDIENDKGNYSLDTLNQTLRLVGLEMGLYPRERQVLIESLMEEKHFFEKEALQR